MDQNILLILIISAFAIGSIPTGYLIARSKGIDIRQHGSGNIGATNVGRVLGKKLALVTFVVDLLKGVIAACLGIIPAVLSHPLKVGVLRDPTVVVELFSELAPILGVCAILGHCFSPFLKFRGGKGVATGLGVFLIITPLPSIIALIVFAIVVKLSSYVSLGSVSGVLSLLGMIIVGVPHPYSSVTVLCSIFVSSLIILRHVPNIRRLLHREELGATSRPSPTPPGQNGK